jgi:hypothetical protein
MDDDTAMLQSATNYGKQSKSSSPPLEAGGDESSLGSMFDSDNGAAAANGYIVFYRYR